MLGVTLGTCLIFFRFELTFQIGYFVLGILNRGTQLGRAVCHHSGIRRLLGSRRRITLRGACQFFSFLRNGDVVAGSA